jgi:gas vesicle protein
MSDALLGVLIGGLIGISGTITTLIIQHKQWKTNKRLEYLQQKRNKYAKDFEIFSKNFLQHFGGENYDEQKLDHYLATDIFLKFPKDVAGKIASELIRFVNNDISAETTRRDIMAELNSSLQEIDEEIDTLTR